ncbi:alpha/beta-hydrolase [Pyrenochaeta sp. DS3sAY3a]|nr:alpha/beta-hydrolase [Pyrenochaeta sp. DS3sAY3a]
MHSSKDSSLYPGGYTSQTAWQDIQQFLPSRLHFTPEHSPTEEWWEHAGYNLHLDRWRNSSAKVRVILHHGVGTNGRQMSMILGVPLHKAGFELVAIDMPGYGCTQAPDGKVWSYDDWVQISSDFIDHELETDPRPIVLYGLSAGGMLTYHSAALNRSQKIKGIIGMTFLDQRIQQVADTTAKNILMSRVGLPLSRAADAMALGRIKIPMSLASKMSTLVNNEAALKVFLSDITSAGSAASMHFLSTYSSYKPAMEPELFDVCPILLTQPAEDRWTPLELSKLFLPRITKAPVTIVELGNAGHYPLEDPGLQQLEDAIVQFLNGLHI